MNKKQNNYFGSKKNKLLSLFLGKDDASTKNKLLEVKHKFKAGEVVGVLDCKDPLTGMPRNVISLSGPATEADLMYEELKATLPEDYTFAPSQIDPEYWAGLHDKRFLPGKNKDGSMYRGDSLSCVLPRLYQYVRKMGWLVNGMTLMWRGDGPNPFPEDDGNPDGKYMRPCPSCEANINSILEGVRIK